MPADTPRVPLVSDPDEEQAELLSRTLLSEGADPLNLFRTMVHNPRLTRRFNVLGGFFLRHGTLPARERELVILRVAARVPSAYERAQHVEIGLAAGLDEDDIARMAEPPSTWPSPDDAWIRFVDELLDSDGHQVPSWDAMAGQLRTDQMLELTMLVGFYRMLAAFLNVVGIEVEDRPS